MMTAPNSRKTLRKFSKDNRKSPVRLYRCRTTVHQLISMAIYSLLAICPYMVMCRFPDESYEHSPVGLQRSSKVSIDVSPPIAYHGSTRGSLFGLQRMHNSTVNTRDS